MTAEETLQEELDALDELGAEGLADDILTLVRNAAAVETSADFRAEIDDAINLAEELLTGLRAIRAKGRA